MWAHSRMAVSIIGLVLTSAGAAAAQGRPVTHLLTAVVPSIVRVEVVAGQFSLGGYPLVRVQTNDPALRTQLANGVPAEVLSSPAVRFSGVSRAKGGESGLEGEARVEPGLVRYTIVRP